MLLSPILFSLKGRSNSLKDIVAVFAYLICTVDTASVTHKKIMTNACPVTTSGLTTQSFPEGIYQIVDPKPHVRFSPHVALTPPHYSLL